MVGNDQQGWPNPEDSCVGPFLHWTGSVLERGSQGKAVPEAGRNLEIPTLAPTPLIRPCDGTNQHGRKLASRTRCSWWFPDGNDRNKTRKDLD